MSTKFFKNQWFANELIFTDEYDAFSIANLHLNDGKYLRNNSGDLEWISPNVANSVLQLNSLGLIDATYLPSYVNDVRIYANLSSFPVTGEADVIYLAEDAGYSYRWNGSTYFCVSTQGFYTKTELDNLFTTETNARIAADNTLTTNLNSEITNRTNADLLLTPYTGATANVNLGNFSITSQGHPFGSGNNNTDNLRVGVNALNSITSGLRNVAVGSGTLSAITTQHNNTAVGYDALKLNANNDNNTAIGTEACRYTTDTINSTCVGRRCGYAMTNGFTLTAVGSNCASACTSTLDSCAFGNNAMNSTSTYNQCVYIGRNSGHATGLGTITGSTCIGYASGTTNINSNTLLGYQAATISTGSGLTIIGYNSGSSLTSGANNIFIGNSAGSSITSTSNNIILGNVTGVAGDANLIRIGDTSHVQGALIPGASDASNATTGYIGEIVTSTILKASAITCTSGVAKNLTSITLTAGRWLISGCINFSATTNITVAKAGISSTTITLPNDAYQLAIQNNATAMRIYSGACATQYFSINATTTYYLVISMTFTGTSGICGHMMAQRI